METRALGLNPARSPGRHGFPSLKSILLAGVFAGLAGGALAEGGPELPTDGVFAAGSGVIGPAIGGNLQVQQTSARGIIDWRTFSIGQGGAVSILNGQGATLNRVTSGQLSVIRGTLSATGSVYLVNPQGVVVSGEGRILAGGAVGLLTRDISNTDFLAGGPFTARGQSDAGVVNLGAIVSREGDVFLVGSSVLNAGEISAGSGLAGLAAGDTVVLAPGEGVRGLYVAAGSGGRGDVSVTGRIDAAAAALQSAGGNVYVLAGNRSGTVQATGVSRSGGEIWLSAPEGEVQVDGALRALKGEDGGDITLSGRTVSVGGSAVLDASGSRGGTVLVGVTAPQTGLSDVTSIASGARILAGGPLGGGMVETSGHLMTIGDAVIRAGEGGHWLVDPVDLTIDAGAASTIASSLNAGTNVTQQTDATGASGAGSQTSGPGDIIVAAPISWTGSGSLTLNAYRDVQVNAAINGTGSGGLTLLAGRGISAGAAVRASTLNLTATSGGITTTGSGTLTGPNGVSLTAAQAISLGGAVSNLTSGQLQVTGSAGVTLSGNVNARGVTVSAGGAVTVSGAVSAPSVNMSANGGDLTIGAAGSVSGTNGVTLGTTGNFINNRGVNGVQSSAGRWLIYSTSPTTDTVGSLAFDFIQYAASYPTNGAGATSPAQGSGNGLLYSLTPTLSFDLTGAISKTYDGTTTATLAPANIVATGLVGPDALALTATYSSANAGELVGVTASGAVITNSGKPVYGYSIPNPSVTAYIGTIHRKAITAAIIGNPTKIYNKSTLASLSSANFQLTGFLSGEGATVVSTTGATYDSDQAGARTVTAGLEVTSFLASGGTLLSNYNLPSTASGAGTINKATVRVVGVLAGNKTYDGTTTATLDISQALLFGEVAGDSVALDLSAARGDYASANVGAGQVITASGFTLSGASAANYTLVQPRGLSGSITARGLSIVGLSAQNKVYDGNAVATLNLGGLSLSGVIAADVGQVNLTTGAASATFETSNAGVGIRVFTSGLGLSGAKAGNYTVSAPTLYANITQRPLTATIIGNPTKVYNATSTATVDTSAYSLSGFVAGQGATVTSKATAYYDSPNAGARTVSVNLTTPDFTANTGTLLSNYLLPTSATGAGTISKAPVTFYIVGNPTKQYDANTVATLSPANFKAVGLIGGDSLTVTQTAGTYDSANAGSRQVTADLTGKISAAAALFTNYAFAATATGTGSITQAPLSVGGSGPVFNLNGQLVGNPTKVYDGSGVITGLTSANFVLTGLQGSDTIQVVKTTGLFEDVNAGVQRIRVDLNGNPLTTTDYLAGAGTLLSNYVLPSAIFGNGTITPKPISISLTGNPSKTYNGSNVAVLSNANYAFTGLVGSDSIVVLQAAQAFYDSANAGARNVTVTLREPDLQGAGSTRLSNYIIPGTVTGTGTILQAPLQVLYYKANNKTYDGTNVASLDFSGASLFGAVTGDVVSLNASGASGTFAQVNAGSGIGVTVTGLSLSGASAANYAIVPLTGVTANIGQRGLSVSGVVANSRSYNATTAATLNTTGATLNGVLPGDVGQVSLNLAAVGGTFISPNVRNGIRVDAYGFALSGAQSGNYAVAQPGGLSANITPAPLTATVVATPTKTYDGTTAVGVPVAGITVSGFFGTDAATVGQYAAAAFNSADAAASVGLTVTLRAPDFVATGDSDLSNYQYPTTATGVGAIDRAILAAQVIGRPTKVYDGGVSATVSAGNFRMIGFVTGQGATVNATSGTYSSANAGDRIVTVSLAGAPDFTANAGTNLANYVLPASATGAGTITPKGLSVSIIGNPTKVYDSTTTATLTSANYSLSGLVGSDTFTVTQTAGTYSLADAGSRTVTVQLRASDFTAGGGALAANYTLPTSATGVGQIDPKLLTLAKVQRVYNSLTTVAGSAYTLAGVETPDLAGVSVNAGAVSGDFDTKSVGVNKLVNLTGVSLTGARSSNYTIASTLTNGAIGVITQASLTFSGPTAVSRVYDGTRIAQIDNSAPIVWSGLFAGDVVSLGNISTTGLFDTKNAGVNKPVTVSGYTVTGADAGNYALVQPAGLTATITPLAGALAVTSVVKTYDGSTALPTASSGYTLSGVLAGDTVTVASATGAGFSSQNAATGLNVSISSITLGGADGGNYVAPSPPATPNTIGTINPRSLTASVTGNPTKTYDASTTATLTSADYTVSGWVVGEGATVTKTAGTYNSANVGTPATGRSVTVSLASGDFTPGGGTLLSNYVLPTSATGGATINPASLTVSGVTSSDKTYDGTTTAAVNTGGATLVGVVGADVGQVSLATGAATGTFSSANVGSWTVTFAGFGLSGAKASNYVLTQPASVTQTIASKLVSVASVTKVYNRSTDASQASGAAYTLAGVLAGDVGQVSLNAAAVTGVYTAGWNVGTGLEVSLANLGLSGAKAGNYAITSTQTSNIGVITQAPIYVSGLAVNSRAYNGSTAATLDTSGASFTGQFAGDTFGIRYPTTGTFASKDVGTWAVTTGPATFIVPAIPGTGYENYYIVNQTGLTGVITKATLSISITGNPTKVYNANTAATLAAGNYSLTGLVGSEGFTVTQTSGTYDSADAGARTVSATLGAGNFTGTGGGLISNYSFPTTVTGAGTISPKAVTATVIGNPTKTYDGSTTATLTSGNYSLSGFLGADNATVTKTTADYSSANAGSRTVTATLGAGDFTAAGGTNLANYALPTSASGVGTINLRALSASITGNPTKTYDANTTATLAAANFNLTGFAPGESATVTKTAGTYSSANAGSRTVSVTLGSGDFSAAGGTLLSNYILPTSATGTGTISQKALSLVIVGTPTKIYDGDATAALTAANFSLTGFEGGQGASVTKTSGTYDSANAGSRTVTATLGSGDYTAAGGTDLSNYVLPTTATGAGVISVRTLSVSLVGALGKTYDGSSTATLSASNFSLSGFVAGEGGSITKTSGTYDSANAGARTLTVSLVTGDYSFTGGALASNYALPIFVSGSATIDPRTLTASIVGNPTKVYDGTTAATLSAANYSFGGFAPGEGVTVSKTAGTYSSANAGSRTVSVALAAGDFTATGGALLSNYVLPTSASGVGTISPKAISVSIIGNPTKIYDASAAADLSASNFSVSGVVAGETLTVSQTSGTYSSANVGGRIVTATLASGNFAISAGGSLSNYILPTSATGIGSIDPRALTASIAGTPARAYDGTTTAVLTASSITLTGFVGGEGATVTRATGTYDSADAGTRNVTAAFSAADLSANAGTRLDNYILPASASGVGRIDPRTLTLSLTGDYSKTYDGLRTAAVAPGALSLTGFVAGQGGSVSTSSGSYDSADAGNRTFTVQVASSEYVLTGGAKASNYVLPTSASLLATISRRALSVEITGTPTRTYDGSSVANLAAGDYRLTGFVSGQGASITQTRGAYASADAGERTVSVTLAAGDFAAQGDTRLSNYVLPTSASGVGRINPAVLTASIVGNPTKPFDRNTRATLTPANYDLAGLVSGQSISVTQAVGAYDSSNAGARTVTATLAAGDFAPAAGVNLSNYVLPTRATGPGTIEESTSGDPVKDILVALGRPEAEAGAISQQAAFAGATPRVFVPFPAPGALSTLRTNGLASLPVIINSQTGRSASGLQAGVATVQSGAPVINAVDSILLQGARDKRWIIYVPMAVAPADRDTGDQ